jgi:cob(I)alamin adenosyltransferase
LKSGLGRVQVYTGNGKGKTTAALGLAVRAACAGMKVYIGQFMKGSDYSELCLPDRFPGLVRMEQYGTPRLLCKGEKPSAEDLAAAAAGLERIHAELTSGHWDVVIADELCVTVHLGLLPETAALELLTVRPPDVELVLTGRYATQGIMAAADLVTEMTEVKHYYSSEGLAARKGIEF